MLGSGWVGGAVPSGTGSFKAPLIAFVAVVVTFIVSLNPIGWFVPNLAAVVM